MTENAMQDPLPATRIAAEPGALRRIDLGLATPYEEPQTEAELKLADIWEQVLGIDAIGITDDFFELGGDSFAATALAAEIEATFNMRFAPADIINLSTIAKQARAVAKEASSPVQQLPSHVIIGSAGGSKPPLFMVHGMAGFAFFKRAFIEEIEEDRPIYLFQVPGLDGRTKPLESVEEIASVYVASIRKIQLAGPYHILAMCAGAFIALEMCNQLEEAGETVARLVLLDPLPAPHGFEKRGESWIRRGLWRFKSLCKQALSFLDRSWTGDRSEQRLRFRAERLQRRIQARRAGNVDWTTPAERSYSPEAMEEASLQLFRAFEKYIPRGSYSGKAALLVSADRASKTVSYGSFWRTYIADFDYQVCGTHKQIFGAQIVETGQFVRNALGSPN